MVVSSKAGRSDAPGSLETVRALLNTWRIPNDTRVPTDLLTDLAADPHRWASQLTPLVAPTKRQLPRLIAVRDQVRRALTDPAELEELLANAALRLRIEPAPEPTLRHESADPTSTSEVILAAVADAISEHTWTRLRVCPDCRWVFYDHTRNGSRTWCGMTAGGPHGRACGSIAKTRSYRQRRAASPR